MKFVRTEAESKYRMSGKRHPFGLLFVTVLATLTISTPAATLFTIPRPFVVAVLATGFLMYTLKLQVQARFWQFALAYLLTFVPGTLYNINQPNIKVTSVFQLLIL